jgi:hypothetical protein
VDVADQEEQAHVHDRESSRTGPALKQATDQEAFRNVKFMHEWGEKVQIGPHMRSASKKSNSNINDKLAAEHL